MPRGDRDEEIRRETARLLLKADVKGRLPTPVDDIVAASGLTEPKVSLLSNFVLEQAPAHLRGPIRKLRLKIRALLDRKTREVHVGPTIQVDGKVAFNKLHEVIHHILPWQEELGYADDDSTLAWHVRQRFEREANVGASELLFQGPLFREMAAQYEIGIASILDLAQQVGASGHASFRRFIQTHRWALAGVVFEVSPCSADPLAYRRREVVCSSAWEEQFGSPYAWPKILRSVPYSFIDLGPHAVATRGVAKGPFRFPNKRNEQVALDVEVYSNTYRLFALMWVPRKERFRHRRRVIAPAATTPSS